MSLPVVTYGNYNYGDYANPRAVQYQGGFGEGLTKAAVSVIESYKEKKAEVKKANEDAYLASAQFNSEMEKLFGKAASANRAFLQDLKQDYGNTVKAYKLGNITLDEYSDRMDYFNGVVNDATLLADVMAPVIQSENDISFDDVRDNPDNRASNLMRNAVRNGRYVLGRDEKGLKIMLPVGDPSNFAVKFVDAKELINNPKYINPDLRYKHIDNDKFSTFLDDFANNSANKGILKKKQDTEVGEEYVVFDDSAEGIEKMKNLMLDQNANPLFSNVLDADEKEKYWEDVMGKDNWTGDEAQRNELNQYLANEAATILSKRGPIRSYRMPKDDKINQLPATNNAITAFNDSINDPLTFYNTQVLTSPTTSERAEYKGNGVYHLITFDKDSGKQNAPVVIDLKNFTEFQKYAGTIQTYHRSIAGTSAEVRQAVAEIANIDELKQKHTALLEKFKDEPRNQEDIDVENFNNMQKVQQEEDYKLAIEDIPTNYNNWSGRIVFGPRFRKGAVQEAKNEHSNLLSKQKQARKKYEKMFPEMNWPWQK